MLFLRAQAVTALWLLLLLRQDIYAFVDDVRLGQVAGPAVRLLPPLAESRGNSLHSGALVEVELELTLAAGYPLESLPQGGLPVQLGLWQHDELTASTAPSNAALEPNAQQQPPLNDASVAQLCGCSANEGSSKGSSHSDSYRIRQHMLAQKYVRVAASGNGDTTSIGQGCGAPYTLTPAALPANPSRFITVYVGEGSSSSNSDSLNSSTSDGISISSGGSNSVSSGSSSSSSESALMVRWNVTVNVGGLYHVGLVHCAPQALGASGVVRWTRGGSTRGIRGGGALPDEILGIVPFYGTLACAYFFMAVGWALRVRQYWDYTIALQLAVFSFLLFNLLYSALAFAYYLHLDLDTDLRADQVFGGIYAGFSTWDPFAGLVAAVRFLLMSLAEVLITALADGLFVTRHALRKRAKFGAFAVVCGQFALLVLQAPLFAAGPWVASALHVALLGAWGCGLAASSVATWRSLRAEESAAALADLGDSLGGAPWQDGEDHLVLNLQWDTPLKQRVYTHVCRAVFVYPALAATTYGAFLVFVDSYQWMWLRLVSFDVWMFGVLVPASFFWLPTANSEYQYAPLADEMPEAQAVMGNAASAIHDQQQRATAQFKASLKALATATPFATCPPSSPYPDGEVHNSRSSVGNSSRSGYSFGTGSGRSYKGEIGRSEACSQSRSDDGVLGEIELSPAGGEGGLHSPARALTFPRTHGLSGVGLSSHDDGGSSTDEESQMIV